MTIEDCPCPHCEHKRKEQRRTYAALEAMKAKADDEAVIDATAEKIIESGDLDND